MTLAVLRRFLGGLHTKKNNNNLPIVETRAVESKLLTVSAKARAEPILSNAIYRFYLIEKYSIKKIDELDEKIRCDEDLFDTAEAAFEYANKLEILRWNTGSSVIFSRV
jgi:hypothetical protein